MSKMSTPFPFCRRRALRYARAARRTTLSDRLLFIELVGLPGAGKTTIAQAIVDMETQESIGIALYRPLAQYCKGIQQKAMLASKLVSAVDTLKVLVRKRYVILRLVRHALSLSPLSSSRLRFVWGLITLLRRVERKRASGPTQYKTVLLDQGIVQILGSIALPGVVGATGNMGVLVPDVLAGCVDGLVWVDCSPEVAMARVRDRHQGHSRFDDWSDAIFHHNQMVMLEVLRDAIQCGMRAGIPILTISSADPPWQNAIRVRAWLHRLISSLQDSEACA